MTAAGRGQTESNPIGSRLHADIDTAGKHAADVLCQPVVLQLDKLRIQLRVISSDNWANT